MKPTDKFILNEAGEPIPAKDLMHWARWFGDSRSRRQVAEDTIGKSRVSTVFLGLDHSFGEGPPILWETMFFGGALNEEMLRCSGGREQAEAMHATMISRVKGTK